MSEARIGLKLDFGTGTTIVVYVEPNSKLFENFTVKEFANNKATDAVKGVINYRVLIFGKMIQEMRNHFGEMNCNSWYRTANYNKNCGGSTNSCHLIGTAFDWAIKKETDKDREEKRIYWEKLCRQNGVIGAINYYTNGYHLEAFTDVQMNTKSFSVRDYRKTTKDW